MMDDFIIRAALAGVAVAVVAAPLGCFVVWRRMAYFGGALSHTALLGVALGLMLNLNPMVGVGVVTIAAALLLSGMGRNTVLGFDTLLGIIAHAALALGLIIAATLSDVRVDLYAYLFGDILAVSADDVWFIWAGAGAVLAALVWQWRALLMATVHSELAHVEGVNVRFAETFFVVLLAIVVALAMKVVGVLLVASMLIIPPAAARGLSRTPEAMAIWAAVLATASVGAGMWLSLTYDTPTGPSIVAASAGLYVVVTLAVRRVMCGL